MVRSSAGLAGTGLAVTAIGCPIEGPRAVLRAVDALAPGPAGASCCSQMSSRAARIEIYPHEFLHGSRGRRVRGSRDPEFPLLEQAVPGPRVADGRSGEPGAASRVRRSPSAVRHGSPAERCSPTWCCTRSIGVVGHPTVGVTARPAFAANSCCADPARAARAEILAGRSAGSREPGSPTLHRRLSHVHGDADEVNPSEARPGCATRARGRRRCSAVVHGGTHIGACRGRRRRPAVVSERCSPGVCVPGARRNSADARECDRRTIAECPTMSSPSLTECQRRCRILGVEVRERHDADRPRPRTRRRRGGTCRRPMPRAPRRTRGCRRSMIATISGCGVAGVLHARVDLRDRCVPADASPEAPGSPHRRRTVVDALAVRACA